MELPLIKIKRDDGYELIINLDNLLCAKKHIGESDYDLVFRDVWILTVSYKEFLMIDKAIQKISE